MKKSSFLVLMASLAFAFSGPGWAATVLKLSVTLPDGNPTTEALKYMGQLAREKSNGELDVQVFGSSSLGTATEAVEMMQLGTLEMGLISAGPVAQFAPEWEIFSLPYVFRDTSHMFSALDGAFGKAMEEAINRQDVVFLGWTDAGNRNVITAKKAIYAPEDLRGLKIRVMNSKLMVDTLNAMGSIATPMDQGEVYSAIQQSVIDGWENNPVTLFTLKLYEVSPYFSWTRHFMTPDALLVSEIVFKKLSPKNQEILKEAARTACEKQHADWTAYIGGVVSDLEKAGVKFNEVKDIDAFVKAVEPVKEAYKKKHGARFLDMIDGAK
ncbi:MAG: TRAP transporter substrate-binding protein [Candidatus Accumulibacter sp.]|jgi:tripartite ATP-independent transporter DctP family solute receptor|nr:TRAP transporter substrate-binding protein [Accumulibacter sp.]